MKSNFSIKSTIDQFNKNIVKFRLVPMESVPSLPVPLKMNDNICLAILFFTGRRIKDEAKIKIFSPNAIIIIDYLTSKIIYFRDYKTHDQFKESKWDEPIGEFPHKEIESLTLKEYTYKRKELLTNYDKILNLFKKNVNDEKAKEGFKSSFYKLCEPSLLPFMRKAGPSFFKWLGRPDGRID